MLGRREFSLGLAASTALLGTGCTGASKPKLRTISEVGIQTYTLRFMYEENPLETFKMIKAAGYDYVELNGRNFVQNPAADIKAMLDETGLYAPATHISLGALYDGITPLIAQSRPLDMKYLIVPWVDENVRSLEDWKNHAAMMNEAGRIFADQGLRLAYHNHQFEFFDLGGGTTAMDVLLNDCAPENVDFELDIFWASLADVDIPELFKQNPGRFKLCHIKDMGPNKADFVNAPYDEISSKLMKNVGEGTIPFEEFFALNDISGMEYFIAEHDNPSKPYADAITTSYKAIQNFKF